MVNIFLTTLRAGIKLRGSRGRDRILNYKKNFILLQTWTTKTYLFVMIKNWEVLRCRKGLSLNRNFHLKTQDLLECGHWARGFLTFLVLCAFLQFQLPLPLGIGNPRIWNSSTLTPPLPPAHFLFLTLRDDSELSVLWPLSTEEGMREQVVTQGPWTDGQQGAMSHQVKTSVICESLATGTMFLCLPSPLPSPHTQEIFHPLAFFSFLTLLFIDHCVTLYVSPGRAHS